MAKSREQEFIQFKYALALYRLLLDNKAKAIEIKKKGKEDVQLADSIGSLSSTTGLRKATISYILSGLSDIKGSTLDLLLDGLGKSYSQFAKYIDSFSEADVLEYKKIKEKERATRRKK